MQTVTRRTLPVPYGRRVYVYSDLHISRAGGFHPESVSLIAQRLSDLDEAAVVVFAGGTFELHEGIPYAAQVRHLLEAVPDFVQALEHLQAQENTHVLILPGASDVALASDDAARAVLETYGVEFASDVVAQCATGQGVRDVVIAVAASDLPNPHRLNDPAAGARFAQSSLLYKKLGGWLSFPLLVLAFLVLSTVVVAIGDRLTHRDWTIFGTKQWFWNSSHLSNWSVVFISLFTFVMIEALVGLVTGAILRARLRRSAGAVDNEPSEPLSTAMVDGVDAITYALRIVRNGAAGAVVGGASRAALAYLDDGFCATPGPCGDVLVERRGRFGLPSVFQGVTRVGAVIIDTGYTLQVRLVGMGTRRGDLRVVERVVAGDAILPSPPESPGLLGNWPSGSPWPLSPLRRDSLARERRARRLVSGGVFAVALINVIFALIPPSRHRLQHLLHVLPLGVAQAATAGTAVTGIGLIMMARGLRRGQRRTWLASVLLLALTTGLHLIHGGTWITTGISAVVLMVLLVRREAFRAETDQQSLPRAIPKLLLVPLFVVLIASATVGLTGHLHSGRAWWNVLRGCTERLIGINTTYLPDGANDFLSPALFTVGLIVIIAMLYLFTRPVVDRRLSLHGTSAERRIAELRARDIVRRHGRGSLDYFALRDDKQFFFFRDSLVAYAVYGGVALISPDPLGPEAERSEVFAAFRGFAEARGWTIAVIGAGESWLPTYHGAGFHSIYIGDEAVVDCQTFSLEGGKMKGLRQAVTRLERKGYTVEFIDPSEIDPKHVNAIMTLIAKLRRGEGERGFSMMLGRLFNKKDKGLLLTIVNGPDGVPAAVCQFVPSPAIRGYSLDLMRRDPDEHPNGLIDFALCSTITYLKEHGGRGLSLNFSAFRNVLDGEKGDGLFTRVERWALKRMSGFLPIESLYSFNAKYQPGWLPRYLIYPAIESLVPVVAAVLRAESLTEIPVVGRLLANDPSNRPGTVVPDDVLAAANAADAE